MQRAVEETREGVIVGGGEPVLPDCHTAVTVGIYVTISAPGNAAADFEHLGLPIWKTRHENHRDIKLAYGTCRIGNGTVFEEQIATADMDIGAFGCRPQIWLIKTYRGFHLL